MTQLAHANCVRLLADIAAALRPSIEEFIDQNTLCSIDQTINQAKVAALGDLPRSDLEEGARTATQLTGRVELCSRGLFLTDALRTSPLARLTPEQLKLVRDVADIAARALRAATGEALNANQECQEGLSWAYAMAERLEDDTLRCRIQSLVANATP